MLFGNTFNIRELSHKEDVILCRVFFCFFFGQAKKKNRKNNFASVGNKK